MAIQISGTNVIDNSRNIINATSVAVNAASSSGAELYVNGNSVGVINALGTQVSNITLDFATANNFSFTLNSNLTLLNPSNVIAGQSGFIAVTQGGSNTLGWGSNWDFPYSIVPVVSSAANAVDVFAYYARSTTSIVVDVAVGIGTL